MTADSGRRDRPATSGRPASGKGVSRRRVLATVGAAGAFALPSRTTRAARTTATLHVRVYPGPKPLYAWLRQACSGITSGWSPIYRDAVETLRTAMHGVASYVRRHSRIDEVDARVERRPPVDFSRLSSRSTVADVPAYSFEVLTDSFRELVVRRDAAEGSCCHLLLWWDPLNADVGYGGTHYPNSHVEKGGDEGAQTVANVGATSWWDSPPVTRNLAIHEALHTFLSDDVVEAVVGSSCDHHLGRAVRTDDGTMRVSPMATAYAGDEGIGSGTRWHGSGCYDHDSFVRHDGTDDVDRWEYTPVPSEATLEAVTLYVERYLAE